MNDLTTSQVVSVVAKVTLVEEPVKIVTKDGKTLTKQDVHIADATGSTRVVLWESKVSSLEVEKSYSLTNVTVKQYLGEKFLSLGKSSTKSPVEDIGEVLEDAEATSTSGGRIIDGEIDSVLSFSTFHKCKLCNSKVDAIDATLGRRTKCRALSKLKKCPLTTFAKVLVGDKAGYDHTLTIFDPVLYQIVETTTSQDDLECKLLMAPPHRFRVTSRDVIFGIEKL